MILFLCWHLRLHFEILQNVPRKACIYEKTGKGVITPCIFLLRWLLSLTIQSIFVTTVKKWFMCNIIVSKYNLILKIIVHVLWYQTKEYGGMHLVYLLRQIHVLINMLTSVHTMKNSCIRWKNLLANIINVKWQVFQLWGGAVWFLCQNSILKKTVHVSWVKFFRLHLNGLKSHLYKLSGEWQCDCYTKQHICFFVFCSILVSFKWL